MPKRCIPCLSHEAKEILEAAIPGLDKVLASIADCDDGEHIRLCGSGSRGKRAPSEYNRYMGTCLKEPSRSKVPITERMRSCASEWKKR